MRAYGLPKSQKRQYTLREALRDIRNRFDKFRAHKCHDDMVVEPYKKTGRNYEKKIALRQALRDM